jgi:hypothetical protein
MMCAHDADECSARSVVRVTTICSAVRRLQRRRVLIFSRKWGKCSGGRHRDIEKKRRSKGGEERVEGGGEREKFNNINTLCGLLLKTVRGKGKKSR